MMTMTMIKTYFIIVQISFTNTFRNRFCTRRRTGAISFVILINGNRKLCHEAGTLSQQQLASHMCTMRSQGQGASCWWPTSWMMLLLGRTVLYDNARY